MGHMEGGEGAGARGRGGLRGPMGVLRASAREGRVKYRRRAESSVTVVAEAFLEKL
jgi:membrane-bound lytic murein transglycosylase MltF